VALSPDNSPAEAKRSSALDEFAIHPCVTPPVEASRITLPDARFESIGFGLEGRMSRQPRPYTANRVMPPPNASPQRFAVLSSARSGSNMLRSLLQAHPKVECLGELFNPAYEHGHANWLQQSRLRRLADRYVRDHSVELYLDSLFAANSPSGAATAWGFKVMYPGQFHRCGIFPYYWQKHDFKIIRLARRNLLRRYVSEKIAAAEGIWSAREYRGKQLTITVDINDLRGQLHRMETIDSSIDALAKEFRHIFVEYTELVSNPRKTMNDIFEFLGVSTDEAAAIAATTVRQNPAELKEVVENYDEVRASLQGSPYRVFLDDEGMKGCGGKPPHDGPLEKLH